MGHNKMKLLSTNDAARYTGFKPRTIAKWCREGKIAATKLGRVWRIYPHVLDELMEDNECQE